jgi:hypothetical protein
MMNEIAIENITRILQQEVANGNNVIGLVSIDDGGHLNLCWRTNDTNRAKEFEKSLFVSIQSGVKNRELVPLPKEV